MCSLYLGWLGRNFNPGNIAIFLWEKKVIWCIKWRPYCVHCGGSWSWWQCIMYSIVFTRCQSSLPKKKVCCTALVYSFNIAIHSHMLIGAVRYSICNMLYMWICFWSNVKRSFFLASSSACLRSSFLYQLYFINITKLTLLENHLC